MDRKFSVSLNHVIKDMKYEVTYMSENSVSIHVVSADVSRPGLILSGYEKFFDKNRVQFIGLAEYEYLRSLDRRTAEDRVDLLLKNEPVAIVVARDLDFFDEYKDIIVKYDVPILKTHEVTSPAMSSLIDYLGIELAARETRHGVLMEISGVGVLITGESGVGKSETALELIKRGHRLVADDAVEIRKTSHNTLIGSAPDNIRHFIELRGVGIINARRIFGMGAVKLSTKIELVVNIELWDNNKIYDRLGLESQKIDILGVEVPLTTVPSKPGRNLSIIIEAAAVNERQKQLGYNAARELLHKLGMSDDIVPQEDELEIWHNY
ncbi:MAG: HPr(Ser) kinase/phosphatase [Clostridia bacterium]|nr:HPr(Ser) kinase/phosphatase [Clostridia bacterium]